MAHAELAAALAARNGWKATEVIPGKLWLGSGRDAELRRELERRGVTDIVNVADDVPNFHEKEGGFRYVNLSVADFGQDKGIARVFSQAEAAVGEVLSTEGRAALVHCAAGQNRSVTIVLAVLMRLQGVSLLHAYTDLKKKRGYICPLRDNREALVAHEVALRGTATMAVDDFADERNRRHMPS